MNARPTSEPRGFEAHLKRRWKEYAIAVLALAVVVSQFPWFFAGLYYGLGHATLAVWNWLYRYAWVFLWAVVAVCGAVVLLLVVAAVRTAIGDRQRRRAAAARAARSDDAAGAASGKAAKPAKEPPASIANRYSVGVTAALGAGAALAIWYTFTRAEMYVEDALSLGFYALGLALFVLIDWSFLKGINTLHELKRGNPAIGLAFLGWCILLAAFVLARALSRAVV